MTFHKTALRIAALELAILSCTIFANGRAICELAPAFTVENDYTIYSVDIDGGNLQFTDKQSHTDYAQHRSPFAWVKKSGQLFAASSVSTSNLRTTVRFGASGISAAFRIAARKHFFTIKVLSISSSDLDELVFANVPLTLKGTPDERFAGCALALNLRTNVQAIPAPTSLLQAHSYRRFGFAGAEVALIGCPRNKLNAVMREVVSSSADLPHSPLGGPWALDSPDNRESYLLNYTGITASNADQWIALARSLGFTQIDLHGGNTFRFGDFKPNPSMYPNGIAGLKSVIARLHAARLKVGLHTYSFFLDKHSSWVTPVPDPRLGKDAEFTLSQPISAYSTTVPVIESTEGMSTVTGFGVRNSVTVQIDDELITYTGISKSPPYAFLGCTRGALGTKPASHLQGAKVGHLKECFGMFVPDGDSDLFTEIAHETADFYNACGFDMIYLDALDGEDIFAGSANGWHYGSLFTFEVAKHLNKPAIMEMSTMHHHLWYVRSRYGAWDSPSRGYKALVDAHVAANKAGVRVSLPSQLGWWTIMYSLHPQIETMFSDDIEYLCCKSLASGAGQSLGGLVPDKLPATPNAVVYADIFRKYEQFRFSDYFSDAVKAQLAVPGKEFTLIEVPTQPVGMSWQLLPVQYSKHKVDIESEWSRNWHVKNSFGKQPIQLRIEALMSPLSYDDPRSTLLADFRDPSSFTQRAAAPGVVSDLSPSTTQVREGDVSGLFSANNDTLNTAGSWTEIGKIFSPTMQLSGDIGLGLWVYGDGQGETLNLQLQSPPNISAAISDHYIVVDFTGWRYYSLVEPESDQVMNYTWPYSSPNNPNVTAIFLNSLDTSNLQSLSLWYNNIPPKGSAGCYLSPIKAIPVVPGAVQNPSVTIGGSTITFPVTIPSGCYLEFKSPADCKLYDVHGTLLSEVTPIGPTPTLDSGNNTLYFDADTIPSITSRANVTVTTQGTSAL